MQRWNRSIPPNLVSNRTPNWSLPFKRTETVEVVRSRERFVDRNPTRHHTDRADSRSLTRRPRSGLTGLPPAGNPVSPLVGAWLLVACRLIWVMRLESALAFDPGRRIATPSSAGAQARSSQEPIVAEDPSIHADRQLVHPDARHFQSPHHVLFRSDHNIREHDEVAILRHRSEDDGQDRSRIRQSLRLGRRAGVDCLPVDDRERTSTSMRTRLKRPRFSSLTDLLIAITPFRSSRDGSAEVAISAFAVSANTPFPWAFIFLYVALTAACSS